MLIKPYSTMGYIEITFARLLHSPAVENERTLSFGPLEGPDPCRFVSVPLCCI
jgi:hypothetical protein